MRYTSKQEIAKWMTDSAVPALHAVHPTGPAGPCWSKIGGKPALPRGLSWPQWKGTSLAFLAQLDFGEMATVTHLPGLPRSGRAFFFYDQEQSTWGFDPKDSGSWMVAYHESDERNAEGLEFPDDLQEHVRFKQQRLAFHAINSLPDFGGRIEVDHQALSEADFDELHSLKSDWFGGLPRHQIGGFPSAVQNDTMELECQLASSGLYCGDQSGYEDPRARDLEAGAAEWMLLLQLDSDDDAGMMWGDVGTLYFWIRRSELARCEFSNVWMILQCC